MNKVDPSILAEVHYFKETKDARTKPCSSGYRPTHQITDTYLTSGNHEYFENDLVFPGDTVRAYITFISPEAYPNSLWVGKVINVTEGMRVVGTSKVLEIYDVVLLNRSPPKPS